MVGLEHVISISAGLPPSQVAPQASTSAPAPQSMLATDTNTASSSNQLPPVHFRVYKISMLRSDNRNPYIKLDSCGPNFDFSLRRNSEAAPETWKVATKASKRKMERADRTEEEIEQARNKPKKTKSKNIDVDEMGDKVGRLHVDKQDLSKLQTRKMKGLKRERAARSAAAASQGMDED